MKTFLCSFLLLFTFAASAQSIHHDLKIAGGGAIPVGDHFQYSPQFALNSGVVGTIGYGLNINQWRYGLNYSFSSTSLMESRDWNYSLMRNQTGNVNLQTLELDVSYHLPTVANQLLTEFGVTAGGFRHLVPRYERYYTVGESSSLLHFEDRGTGIFYSGNFGLKLALGNHEIANRKNYLTLRATYRVMPTEYDKRVLRQGRTDTNTSNVTYQFFLIRAGLQFQL